MLQQHTQRRAALAEVCSTCRGVLDTVEASTCPPGMVVELIVAFVMPVAHCSFWPAGSQLRAVPVLVSAVLQNPLCL
jgi:hypothetical protein